MAVEAFHLPLYTGRYTESTKPLKVKTGNCGLPTPSLIGCRIAASMVSASARLRLEYTPSSFDLGSPYSRHWGIPISFSVPFARFQRASLEPLSTHFVSSF